MDLLPTFVGTRPRLACEIRPEGVVAARGESPAGTLTAIARAELRPGAVLPGLKVGNIADRAAVVAAIRRTFDSLAARGADRSRYITVVVPDAAVRVLLLDFDALPSKPAEALQVVRFRLKKLLPFEVDHALVSFQIMSAERSLLRVLAVAIPQEVLTEYESVVTEAGLQPGVVLPSTLAALAGLDPAAASSLVLNASPTGLTTAIVSAGILLLHRTVEVYPAEGLEAAVPLASPSASIATSSGVYSSSTGSASTSPQAARLANPHGTALSPALTHEPGAFEPPSPNLFVVDRVDTAEEWSRPELDLASPAHISPTVAVAALNTAPDVNNRSRDLAESVSVAAAYFEDTLGTVPDLVLSAGTTSAQELDHTLLANGLEGLRVRELLEAEAFAASAPTAPIPPGWLAGVRGALRS